MVKEEFSNDTYENVLNEFVYDVKKHLSKPIKPTKLRHLINDEIKIVESKIKRLNLRGQNNGS